MDINSSSVNQHVSLVLLTLSYYKLNDNDIQFQLENYTKGITDPNIVHYPRDLLPLNFFNIKASEFSKKNNDMRFITNQIICIMVT